jgi:hypothetical protein
MLEEHQILLCSQETDLDVQEAILAEELACGLHPPDGRDLTAELEEIHVCMDRINEAGRLSKLAVEISHSFVDLGMLHVVFPFLLSFAPRSDYNIHFHIYICMYVFIRILVDNSTRCYGISKLLVSK